MPWSPLFNSDQIQHRNSDWVLPMKDRGSDLKCRPSCWPCFPIPMSFSIKTPVRGKIENSTSCRISIAHQLRKQLDAVRQAFEHKLSPALTKQLITGLYTAPEHSLMCRLLETWLRRFKKLSSSWQDSRALTSRSSCQRQDLATYQERMERILGKDMTKRFILQGCRRTNGRVKARSA